MGNKVNRTRKLSIFRIIIALVIISGVSYLLFSNWDEIKENIITQSPTPSALFAPYVDITAVPQYDFEKLGLTPGKNVVLSFIVSSSQDACIPTWGNAYTLDQASDALDLDRRIARLRQLGGDIAISFGGLLNDELALGCTDENRLKEAYLSVINKYNANTLDLDLEGRGLTDLESIERRARVLNDIQKELRADGKDISIWLTLPVIADGLTLDGTNAVEVVLKQGLDIAGVNIMTMNFGESRRNLNMFEASQRAAIETHRQLGIIYKQQNIRLSNRTLWQKIGLTPMIGQNDVSKDNFSLENAKALNTFVKEQGILRVSMWSANRDIQCGDNYVNLTIVSDSCSGIRQEAMSFIYTLGDALDGVFLQNVIKTVSDEGEDVLVEDDPENSPYPIWSENNVYLEGSKIVWRRNVYVSKWWTQGDLPDNPVLQSWQTPWQLVGPVLPGEKPVEQLKLPEGFYPEWSGLEQYEAGERILFNGIAFQAKWWTQGDSPAASSSNPTSSPWIALTQSQVEKLLQQAVEE